MSHHDDANVFRLVCVSNVSAINMYGRASSRKVWKSGHTPISQGSCCLYAIWMFLDWEENPCWQREILQRCYVRPRKGNRMKHRSIERAREKAHVDTFRAAQWASVIRGKDPPWRFPLQLLGAFTPQHHLKTISPLGNAKSFRLSRHLAPLFLSPRSTENVR